MCGTLHGILRLIRGFVGRLRSLGGGPSVKRRVLLAGVALLGVGVIQGWVEHAVFGRSWADFLWSYLSGVVALIVVFTLLGYRLRR
jgi:hypothetical protein